MERVEFTKRLVGWLLLAVAIAAVVGALVTFLIWQSRAILLTAIIVEAIALVGLVVLLVWPEPAFDAGQVNPKLVRCPRCSTVFDPPKRGGAIVCPTCGLEGASPSRQPKDLTGTS